MRKKDNLFCFWDNSIWISCVNFSQLRREYLLRFCISLRDIFPNSFVFTVINKYGKGGVVQISLVFGPLPCCFRRGCLKGVLLEISLTTLFGVRNFRNTWVMRTSFFWKWSKFNINFKNAERIWENVFYLWENCIWIGCL